MHYQKNKFLPASHETPPIDAPGGQDCNVTRSEKIDHSDRFSENELRVLA